MATALSPLAARNVNVVDTPTPVKRAPMDALSPQPMEIDALPEYPKAKDVLYSNDATEVADLVSLFQSLALDPTLDETVRKEKVAKLMDMGPETDEALRELKKGKMQAPASPAARPPSPQKVASALQQVKAEKDGKPSASWWKMFKNVFWSPSDDNAAAADDDADEESDELDAYASAHTFN
ncbi:hypothetical protein DIPPA_35633 [Diplonema papillatum]|nr:hypothetical protein DIPPA_35633 [Diplonema papillatum]